MDHSPFPDEFPYTEPTRPRAGHLFANADPDVILSMTADILACLGDFARLYPERKRARSGLYPEPGGTRRISGPRERSENAGATGGNAGRSDCLNHISPRRLKDVTFT